MSSFDRSKAFSTCNRLKQNLPPQPIRTCPSPPPRIHFCSEKIIFKSRVFAVALPEGKKRQIAGYHHSHSITFHHRLVGVFTFAHYSLFLHVFFSGRYSLLDMMQWELFPCFLPADCNPAQFELLFVNSRGWSPIERPRRDWPWRANIKGGACAWQWPVAGIPLESGWSRSCGGVFRFRE